MTNKKRIMKSIRSLKKIRREHLNKIEKEKKGDHNEDVIGYWEGEVKTFDNEIKKKQQKL